MKSYLNSYLATAVLPLSALCLYATDMPNLPVSSAGHLIANVVRSQSVEGFHDSRRLANTCKDFIDASTTVFTLLYGTNFSCTCENTDSLFDLFCSSTEKVCCEDVCNTIEAELGYNITSVDNVEGLFEGTCVLSYSDNILRDTTCVDGKICEGGASTCACNAQLNGINCSSCTSCESFSSNAIYSVAANCSNVPDLAITLSRNILPATCDATDELFVSRCGISSGLDGDHPHFLCLVMFLAIVGVATFLFV
jgi:hypothetical protein